MTVRAAPHPLARGIADIWRAAGLSVEAGAARIAEAQALGEALDARLDALDTAAATPASRNEIRALTRDVIEAERFHGSGRMVEAWREAAVAAISAHDRRIFGGEVEVGPLGPWGEG